MLDWLHVKNFALVEEIEVDFRPGLNVITGETGAGKSILMNALSLLLGERADKTVVRTGEKESQVESRFMLSDPAGVNVILEDAGVEPCAEGELVLRRTVAASGPGKNFINGCATTQQVLKKVGDLLVDMHGPHDHQSLLNTDSQMDILDAFGGLIKARNDYGKLYSELTALQTRRDELDCDDMEVARQMDMLAFQIQEIEEAAITEGEEEELRQEHGIVTNAQQILEAGGNVCNVLSEGESSVIDALATVQRELGAIRKIVPEAEEWADEAESAAVQVQELSKSISSHAQSIEADPQRLTWLEDRLGLYQKLKRKYGQTTTDILAHLDECRQRYKDLSTRGKRIAEIEKEIVATEARVKTVGKKLGDKRRKAASALAKEVTAELRDLGFAKGQFSVDLAECEPRPSGCDEIEFGFAPNVGESMRPLRAIASSGEISRVMLATKAVLASHDKIPVLVFDEIDANVGGEMGNAIGSKMGVIAGNHQVLCITHLPQVAVHGSTHFAVAKHVRGDRTYTELQSLDGDNRVGEVARMLGGEELTSVTRDHASEMLAAARK